MTNNGDGSFTLNGTNTYSGYIDLFITPNVNPQTIIKDLENGTYLLKIYELSGNINFNSTNCHVIATGRGENNKVLNSMMEISLHNNKQYQVKSLENCKLTTAKFYIGPGVTFNNYKFKIMLAKTNDESSSWVAHQEQTFTFPLGNEKLMLGDYLADDGIHHVRKQIVLDGSENWQQNSTYLNVYLLDGFLKDALIVEPRQMLSDYFGYGGLITQGSSTVQIGKFYQWKTLPQRLILGYNSTSLNEFKTWLSTHNTTVEYELEKEIIVPYTSAQQEVYNQIKQALSYEEQTNISGSSDGSNPIFSVEAYQDAKVILAEKYVKPSTGIPKTDLASAVQTSLNKADTAIQEHQDISGKQDITDNTLTTINKTVPTAINEVNSIAKLANQAKSYSTYQAFINYLNTAEKTEFIPGQSFMIQTKLVPDLWVYSVENTSVQYTYTTDEDFITYTNQATGGQVGYYKLAQLETQKVDLTDYATKTYVNNLFNSIVDGDEVSY